MNSLFLNIIKMKHNNKNLLISPLKGLKKVSFSNKENQLNNNFSKENLINLLNKENYEEAYKTVKFNLGYNSDDSRLWFIMGVICRLNIDFKNADHCLKKALKLEPSEVKIIFEYCLNLLDLKDYKRLSKTLRSYNKDFQNKPEIIYIMALYHMHNQNYIEARKNYLNVLRAKINIENLFFNYAILLTSLEKHSLAIKYYTKALSLKPLDLNILQNLSSSFIILRKFEDAKIILNKILSIDSNDIKALINNGIIYLRQGQINQAKALFEKALKFDENNLDVLTNIANLSHMEKSYDDAIKFSKKIIEIDENNIDGLNILSGSYQEKKDYDKAILFSKKILRLDSANLIALMNLVNSSFRLKQYKKVNKYSDMLRKLDPCNPLLASLDPLISFNLNKSNNSSFIENPFDFIKEYDLSMYEAKSNALISEVIKFSQSVESEKDPKGKTTVNGIQTLPTIFDSKNENINKLENIIRKCTEDYIKAYSKVDNLYIKRWPSIFSIQGWTVFLKNQGKQNSHNHLSGWMSGVIYLQVPNKLNKKNEGAIEFSIYGYDYPKINKDYPKQIFIPKNGSMILFPSSLYHKTIPTISNEERISLAFDIMPIENNGNRIGLGA